MRCRRSGSLYRPAAGGSRQLGLHLWIGVEVGFHVGADLVTRLALEAGEEPVHVRMREEVGRRRRRDARGDTGQVGRGAVRGVAGRVAPSPRAWHRTTWHQRSRRRPARQLPHAARYGPRATWTSSFIGSGEAVTNGGYRHTKAKQNLMPTFLPCAQRILRMPENAAQSLTSEGCASPACLRGCRSGGGPAPCVTASRRRLRRHAAPGRRPSAGSGRLANPGSARAVLRGLHQTHQLRQVSGSLHRRTGWRAAAATAACPCPLAGWRRSSVFSAPSDCGRLLLGDRCQRLVGLRMCVQVVGRRAWRPSRRSWRLRWPRMDRVRQSPTGGDRHHQGDHRGAPDAEAANADATPRRAHLVIVLMTHSLRFANAWPPRKRSLIGGNRGPRPESRPKRPAHIAIRAADGGQPSEQIRRSRSKRTAANRRTTYATVSGLPAAAGRHRPAR